MNSPDHFPELFELLETLGRDEMDSEQQARLEHLVAHDQELRRAYVRYLHMQVCLRRVFEGAASELPRQVRRGPEAGANTSSLCSGPFPRPVPKARAWGFSRRWRGAALAASVLVLAGLAVLLWHWRSGPSVMESDHVAVLSNAVGCAWERSEPLERGAQLPPGRLELNAGIAEVTFRGGAVVLVEAPAILELVDAGRGFLHSGRIVVKVPPHATGFVVETKKARLLDIGTEFGVGVGNAGETLVQVFSGVVVADLRKGPSGEQRLTAGETMEIDGPDGSQPRALPTVEQRFVRRFPNPSERGDDWLVPYNERRYDMVHVVPAPGPVQIDGDLRDWDRSGAFLCRCVEPFSRDYYVDGMMMYDADNLYIAAHVGDPAPMCSVIDPASDPTAGWRGGGVQVRLSTDRALGWPLHGQIGRLVKGYQPHPQDKNENIVHLTMWYYRPAQEACLHIHYGMDLHGGIVNPPGFRGVFRKDADGRGYVLEYAIPWSVMHAGPQQRPRAGDVLGACWNVHWSDEDGRLWKGYLIDVLNPDEKGFTYQRAATWGRAIYGSKASGGR